MPWAEALTQMDSIWNRMYQPDIATEPINFIGLELRLFH